MQVINAHLASQVEVAATDYLLAGRIADRIAADGTCQIWRGERVWQWDSLDGITLHQIPQIPGSGDFLPNFYPKVQSGVIKMLYILVTATNGASRPECASSFPS